MTRSLVWLVVSPVVAAGVLTAHALAYRLTGAPVDPFHAYLEHAPQVLLVLAVAGVILAGLGARVNAPPARVFPFVALATFVFQEHLERLAHDGSVPFLLTSPTFLVGLALQIPVAFAAWALAHWLLAAVCPYRPRRRSRVRVALMRLLSPIATLDPIDVRIPSGRGPPKFLPSR